MVITFFRKSGEQAVAHLKNLMCFYNRLKTKVHFLHEISGFPRACHICKNLFLKEECYFFFQIACCKK